MNHIIICLLTEEERQGLGFQGVKVSLRKIEKHELHEVESAEEALKIISSYNSDTEALTFTFLGHGGKGGLSDNKMIRISYQDLLLAINDTFTKFPVIANFLANCNSENALLYLPENCKISEIWYNTNVTNAIARSIQALSMGSFERFCFGLEPKDLLLYKKWHL